MKQRDPFKCFKTSEAIIRLAVMLYVRFPLSFRSVEDLLHERGIDVSHEAVRFWWHRFGPVFAAKIRKRRIEGMKSSKWRWHLDEIFVTDKLRSYGAALRELGLANLQETERWKNNRAENSLLPFRRRERTMLCFRHMRTLQKFDANHASVHNLFDTERSLYSRADFNKNRAAALTEWRGHFASQGLV